MFPSYRSFPCCIVAMLLGLCLSLAVSPAMGAGEEDGFLLLTTAARNFNISASAVIGPAGGQIRVGDAQVQFPAATLPEPTLVTLQRVLPAGDFSDANDPAYLLDIATTAITKDSTVSLAAPGQAEGTGFMALESSLTRSDGMTETLPAVVVSGVVQGGRLTVTLPAVEAGARAAPSARTAGAQRVKYKIWHLKETGVSYGETARFRVTCPTRVVLQESGIINRILEYAEQAYALLTGMGFSFDAEVTWPVNIAVSYDLPQDVNGLTNVPLSGKSGQSLILSRRICRTTTLDALRATVGHEFFHLVQHLRDPRTAVEIRNHYLFTPHFNMLADASSTWFEARMLNSATYVSPVFEQNEYRHANGLESWTTAPEGQGTGYWGSGFLRFLRDAKGTDNFLSQLWTAVHAQGTDGNYSDLRALFDCFGVRSVLAGHWRTFMNKWQTGTTGYAGWRLPSSDMSWYFNTSGPGGQILQNTEPFSGRKWRFNFGSLGASKEYFFNIISDSTNLAYALYKETIIASNASTFQHLADLSFNSPYRLTVADGDVYAVVVSNHATAAPYTVVTQAGIRVGQDGANSTYCRDVPNDAAFSSGTLYYQWRHASQGYLVADETYFDAAKKNISNATCFWYSTGKKEFYGTWYSNGSKRVETNYDGDGLAHGQDKRYYDSGLLQTVYTWDHGHQTGPFYQYHTNGKLYCQGGFLDGLEDGAWIYYDEAGVWLYTCTYVSGTLTGCVYP